MRRVTATIAILALAAGSIAASGATLGRPPGRGMNARPAGRNAVRQDANAAPRGQGCARRQACPASCCPRGSCPANCVTPRGPGSRRGGGSTTYDAPRGRRGGTPADTANAVPAPDLTSAEQAALKEALLDEYRAEALYDAALREFGADRCFENLRRAEGHHIAALRSLHDAYGLIAPTAADADPVTLPATLADARDAAIAFEKQQGPFYDRLLESVRQPDIRGVFERLREVSLTRHLPALERSRDGRGRR